MTWPLPQLLDAVLKWRNRRASARTFGLAAFTQAMTSIASLSAQRSVLMWLRPALRGVTEREVRTAVPTHVKSSAAGRKAALSEHPWTLRHHYSVHLQGCSEFVMDKLQAAFVTLFTNLSVALSSAAAVNNQALMATVMWVWGCDVDAQDHEFVLRSGVLTRLASKFSLEVLMAESHSADGAEAGASKRVDSGWKPWRLDEIRNGLLSGWLSKHQVIAHVLAAPDAAVVAGPSSASESEAAAGASNGIDAERMFGVFTLSS